MYRNITLNYTLEGEWKDGQPNGLCKERKWNYSFDGEFKNGKKNGNGVEINDWQKLKADQSIPNYGRYEYKGSFKDGLFDRQGIYQSKESTYVYNGEFKAGLPFVLPK